LFTLLRSFLSHQAAKTALSRARPAAVAGAGVSGQHSASMLLDGDASNLFLHSAVVPLVQIVITPRSEHRRPPLNIMVQRNITCVLPCSDTSDCLV
jgi:hypothetical protein